MHAGSDGVVRRLLAHGLAVDAVDDAGDDALGHALWEYGAARSREADWRAVARALVAAGADVVRAPRATASRLWRAAFRYEADVVDFLLSVGAKPQADSADGASPLHGICWQSGRQPDVEDSDAVCERVVRALVSAGNSVDAIDAHGLTPLVQAVGGDGANAAAARVLLELGADANRSTPHGTPLTGAARDGCLESVRSLLRAGADVRARDAQGRTALDHARDSWRIRKGLVRPERDVAASEWDLRRLAAAASVVSLLESHEASLPR